METRLKYLFLAFFLCCFSWVNAADLSDVKPLTAELQDGVPWFAVREASASESVFNLNILEQEVSAYDRVALTFFATWCEPCMAGVKRLANSYSDLQRNKVKVILVNVGERDNDLIAKWVGRLGASNFLVIKDSFSKMVELFGLVKPGQGQINLPQTLVLDKQAKPLFMIGKEGSDWPEVIWKRK